MAIIDVDSHGEPAPNWLDEFPSLKKRMPEKLPQSDPRFALNSGEMFAFFVSHDVLRFAPRERRMSIEAVTTPLMRAMYSSDQPFGHGGFVQDGASMCHVLDAATRVRWMNAHGIAMQHIITGVGYTLMRTIDQDPGLARDVVASLNTWMTDRTIDHRDRLMPVACLHYDDLDWAVRELTRVRERGCRAFLVSGEPVAGLPPFHPKYDRLWSAATDLGMAALLHIGLAPAQFHSAWANTDDPTLIRLIANSQNSQASQVFLNGMVFGGVFERHPTLTLLICELGIDWFPSTVEQMDGRIAALSGALLGEYRLPLKPSEYVRRNVRITPLPAGGQSPVPTLKRLPEVACFSSDMPHYEGNPSAVEFYEKELAAVDERTRSGFLSRNILESYKQMGDPLEVAK